MSATSGYEAILPGGKKIKFREPRNSDRRGLLEGFSGEELGKRDGRLEEALCYSCLLEVDGRDVSQMSWAARSDLLTIKEGQFYQALFLESFTLNREELTQAQQQAKNLLRSVTVES